MSNKLKIYMRDQWQALSGWFLLLVTPLALFFKFSPYPLPYLEFVIITALFVFQYGLFDERSYKKQIEGKATLTLEKDLKRRPSKTEIVQRVALLVSCRHVTIFLDAVLVIISVILFKPS